MSNSSVNQEYFAALNRLITRKTVILSKGTKVNRNNVALEAGRKIGSVRKGKPEQAELNLAIDDAMKKQKNPTIEEKVRTDKWKSKYEEKEANYEAVLGRELMLIKMCRKLGIENEKLKKDIEGKLPYVNITDYKKP